MFANVTEDVLIFASVEKILDLFNQVHVIFGFSKAFVDAPVLYNGRIISQDDS